MALTEIHKKKKKKKYGVLTSAAWSMWTVRFFSSSSILSLIMEVLISAAVAEACSTPVSSSSDRTPCR